MLPQLESNQNEREPMCHVLDDSLIVHVLLLNQLIMSLPLFASLCVTDPTSC